MISSSGTKGRILGRRVRVLGRGSTALLGGLLSFACLIPEYTIEQQGSGGNNGDGGADGSGGGESSGGGSLPQNGDGGTGGEGASGGSGGNGTGGGTSGGGGSSSGGSGSGGGPWSCMDEESNLPSYYSSGTLCGYRFAFGSPDSGDNVPTFSPACSDLSGADCFRDGYEVVSGVLPPSAPPDYPAIGIGLSLQQPSVGSTKGAWELEGYGIAVDYLAFGAQNPARIQLRSDGDTFCAAAPRNTPLAWRDFRFECWDPSNTETLQAGDPIDELQVSIGSTDEEQTITTLDIEQITLLAAEPPVAHDGAARLFVPLGADAADNIGTAYILELGQTFDLSDPADVMIVHVLVQTAGTAGGLQVMLRGAPGDQAGYFWFPLGDREGWQELVVYPAQGPIGTGYDPADIQALGLRVTSGTPPAGSTTADTTVYLDGFSFSGNVPFELSDITFFESLQGLTMDTSSDVNGSTLEWVAAP